jgi:hypothetical protein
MTAMELHFDVVVRGAALAGAFQQAQREVGPAGRSRLHMWTEWSDLSRRNAGQVFVVSALRTIAREPELSCARQLAAPSKRFLLFLGPESIPAESLAESLIALGARSKERLHLARLEVDDEHSFLRRFVAALLSSDAEDSIIDAWWDRDELVVISPRFQRLRIPFSHLPVKLRRAAARDRLQFDIDPDGEFIYWPTLDIHMGWPQFQQAVDPRARLKAQQKHGQFNQRYGQAIRALRRSKALSQRTIAGLDERTVRRIEQGQTRATASAINKLAAAHGMTPANYMAVVAELLDAPAS